MNTGFRLVDMPNVSIPLSEFFGSREEESEAGLPEAELLSNLTREFAEAVRDHIRLLNSRGFDADQTDRLRHRTLRVVDALRRLWSEIVGHLGDAGLEAGRCRKLCSVALEAFDAELESLTILRNMAAPAEQAHERSTEGGQALNAAVDEVTTLRVRLALVLEQASTPHAAVDREKLQQSEAAFQQGNVTSLRDYLARRKPRGSR